MKKRIPTFLAGMLTMALISGLGVTALAESGAFTITVNPVSVQVNGQTFAPKDAKGNDVPVFSYNGTTYAPLRALAEAYGLNVGWDQGAQMATVGETATTPAPDTTASNDYSTWSAEDEAAYQEFKGLWEVVKIDKGDVKYDLAANIIGGPWESYKLKSLYDTEIQQLRDAVNTSESNGFTNRLAKELGSPDVSIELCFYGKGDGWHFISATLCN